MANIRFQNVSFVKDGVQILKNINLEMNHGEYITLVGLTGAGKSSLIALISGLYTPTTGKIFFDEQDVSKLPANERNCGFMFESYVLFPHLTVLDNIAYGQHMKSRNKEEIYTIAREVLDLVKLNGRGYAYPKECSGGMQQRVALARALMSLDDGGILILDEPFKALDAGLRLNLRREVRKIAKNKNLHLTTIHVTNDMEEAMMGDRIIFLHEGKIQQIGTPEEIKFKPKDSFIAEFFSTHLNKFYGEIISIEDIPDDNTVRNKPLQKITIKTNIGDKLYAKIEPNHEKNHFSVGDSVVFLIHAQNYKIRHGIRTDKTNSFLGIIKSTKFMGPWVRLEIALENNPSDIIFAEVPTTRVAEHDFIPKEEITVYYNSEFVLVFPYMINKPIKEIM